METKTMTWWGNNISNYNFWKSRIIAEENNQEKQLNYGEYIRQGVRDMSYKKAIKKHELEQQNAEAAQKLVDVVGKVFKDAEDIVTKPKHYHDFEIEPSDFIMKNQLSFWKGNIVKYASRAGLKVYDGMDEVESEITDLRKAIRYAEMRINQLEGKLPNAIS